MHQPCKLTRSRILRDTFSITPTSTQLFDFLLPAFFEKKQTLASQSRRNLHSVSRHGRRLEACFFDALEEASLCGKHRKRGTPRTRAYSNHTTTLCVPRRHAHSLRHQRFDSKGRLIVETTAARHPAFPHQKYENGPVVDEGEQRFAASTRLPPGFFSDLGSIRNLMSDRYDKSRTHHSSKLAKQDEQSLDVALEDKLKLMRSVRDLEEKLQKAKQDLARSITSPSESVNQIDLGPRRPTTLTRLR